MWFNNLLVYEFELDTKPNLNEALAEHSLKPCPAHARFSYGWLPVYAGDLVQEVAGVALLCLGKEERILPRGVIVKLLNERIQALEIQENRKIGRTEKSQMAEDLEFELLPKAFTVQKKLFALLDMKKNRLIINTASNTQATQLISELRKSLPGLKLSPIFPNENLARRIALWITEPSALPSAFQLASDCLLFSLENEKKRVTCKGYELPADEIITLLAQGLLAAELSLIWKDRIQFTVTQDLTLKRIKSLEYLVDEFKEIGKLEEEYLQQDAKLTLLSGELRELADELLAATVDTA